MRRRFLATLASLCGALLVRGQEFAPVPGPVAAVAAIQLATDSQLELANGTLRLRTAAGVREVGCTREDGAGTVHAVARSRLGTVFVAAEQGLFVLDAEHPVLDPMDLRDGVPPGTPRGLCIDASDRLWLCTDRAFGVVDIRFGFGRTFAVADGVPAAPFTAVALDATGRVLLAARDGTFAYTPDRGPPPRRIGDAPAGVVIASSDGDAPLALQVAATGGASLRQRRQHDHQLRAMDGAVLRGLRPGRHVVEVHAIDRDLRRVVVATCDVQVPLAPVLSTRFLPLLAAGAGLVLFAFAWSRTRPQLAIGRRLLAAAGSALLVFVCGLELLAASLGRGRSWPFVGFSMYTENWFQDAILYHPRLQGLLADGTPVLGAEEQIGLIQDGYWQMLAEVVFGGPDAQQAFLRRWNAGRSAELPRLAGFRLADGRIRLSAAGPVDVAPTVLVQYEGR